MNDHFRQALIDGDVALCRKIMAHVYPKMPQPESDHDALVTMHYARTAANSIPLKYRAYSHRWLLERSLPSGLPDQLKPAADRLYPHVVDGVGIAVKTLSRSRSDLVVPIRKAMEDAVLDCYAEGDKDPELIKRRMQEARWKIDK